MLRILQQFPVEIRARRKVGDQVHAGAGGDVLNLGLRANQLRVLRKCMRAHVVLGVHVGGDNVDRLAGADLGDFAEHRLSIARAHAGVDHEHGLLPNNDSNIGDQRGRAVGDGPDVIREFPGDAFAHQRRGGRRDGLLGNPREGQKQGGNRTSHHVHVRISRQRNA